MLISILWLSKYHYVHKANNNGIIIDRQHSLNIVSYMYIYIYIYVIVEKSPNSSHMYDHGFMDNTNRQAV